MDNSIESTVQLKSVKLTLLDSPYNKYEQRFHVEYQAAP